MVVVVIVLLPSVIIVWFVLLFRFNCMLCDCLVCLFVVCYGCFVCWVLLSYFVYLRMRLWFAVYGMIGFGMLIYCSCMCLVCLGFVLAIGLAVCGCLGLVFIVVGCMICIFCIAWLFGLMFNGFDLVFVDAEWFGFCWHGCLHILYLGCVFSLIALVNVCI